MTPAKTKLILDLTSLCIAIAGGILGVANQITAIPGLPGWLVNAWPTFIVFATVVDRVGNIILAYLKTGDVPAVPAPIAAPAQHPLFPFEGHQ